MRLCPHSGVFVSRAARISEIFVYMMVNKIIRGGINFQVSKVKICREVKVDLPNQHMTKTAALYMHKHLTHRKCDSIINQLIIPKHKVSHIYVKNPQLGIYNASLDRCVELYNRLPTQVKAMTIAQFKCYTKKNDLKTN